MMYHGEAGVPRQDARQVIAGMSYTQSGRGTCRYLSVCLETTQHRPWQEWGIRQGTMPQAAVKRDQQLLSPRYGLDVDSIRSL